jgi:hypothetical protein
VQDAGADAWGARRGLLGHALHHLQGTFVAMLRVCVCVCLGERGGDGQVDLCMCVCQEGGGGEGRYRCLVCGLNAPYTIRTYTHIYMPNDRCSS